MNELHVRASRRHVAGLLARPPCTYVERGGSWADLVVDRAAELQALGRLVERGLLSKEEMARFSGTDVPGRQVTAS